MKLTMKEIATLSQVSQTAVSLILNGKDSGHISPEKRQRVLDVVAQQGYKPNFAARCLRQKKTSTIGILFPVPHSSFTADIISTLQSLLEQQGYRSLFSFWPAQGQSQQAFDTMAQYDLDGLIACEPSESIQRFRVPTVLYYQQQPGADTVTIDYSSAIPLALKYLMALGHQRIGYLGLFRDSRYLTFLEVMKQMGLELKPQWAHDIWGYQEPGYQATQKLLALPPKQRPTAIITQNEMAAQGVYFAMHEAGLSIPRDLSVISFDNNDDAPFMIPPLTAFDKSGQNVAKALVDQLMERIKHPKLPEHTVLIPQNLILRQSCAPVKETL